MVGFALVCFGSLGLNPGGAWVYLVGRVLCLGLLGLAWVCLGLLLFALFSALGSVGLLNLVPVVLGFALVCFSLL